MWAWALSHPWLFTVLSLSGCVTIFLSITIAAACLTKKDLRLW